MSVPCKLERALLSHDEYETIRRTHHPDIYDVDPAELAALRSRLRQMRAKEQTLARQKRRESRGKAEARGASFPGTAARPAQRKQVFAAALKRVNKEVERLQNLEARAAHVEAARRALSLRRTANFIPWPSAEPAAREGMQARPSMRRRRIVAGAHIGRVSQATRVAQAVRDARGA